MIKWSKLLFIFVLLCIFHVYTEMVKLNISSEKNSNSSKNKTLLFKANFSKSTLSAAFGNSKISFGNKNVKLWANGSGFDVRYPAGSHVPAGPILGGFGTWTKHPVDPKATAVFKYSVYFPENFNFVKGGKLPGLYGGYVGCSGGRKAKDCFSTRIMWRVEGQGELYLYANREAQDPKLCEMPNNFCHPIYGWSLSTGSFNFSRGLWANIEQDLTLNTPGQRNGIVSIRVNGKEVIKYSNIVFRTSQYPNMRVEGMEVETFFGGNGPQWASPTEQISKFKDFSLEYYY